MVKIASQHKWKDSDYKPTCAWSDDTFVQWGGHGVVLGENSYTTAFFEAFPPKDEDAGGFIRGEGSTIAEAEANAFKKYSKGKQCNHLWGREKYTNSGQLCRRCRAFRSGFIQPIYTIGKWREPIKYYEEHWLTGHEMPENKYIKKLRLRRNLFGVTVRHDGGQSKIKCPPTITALVDAISADLASE